MMRRRHFLASATGLAATPLLGGLARPALAQSTSKTLRFVPGADLASIDPLWSLAVISFTHGYMVWDTLFGIDLRLQPHPQMAERAEVSEDQLTWTITLRPGLLFHDNEPVRGRDCVASLKRWSEKDPFGQTIAGITAEMSAIDDRSFKIVLKRPFRQMLYALAARNAFVMPERIVSIPSSVQFKEVIGSGPYRFLADEWHSGAHAHYTRFDKYAPRSEPAELWAGGKVAHFDRVEWITQPDPATAAAALQRGEVDWVERPLVDLVPMLQKSPGIKVEALDPFGALAMLRFNQLQPPFDNPKLRQALLPAIDQQEVVTSAVGEQQQFGKFPVGFFTAGSPMSNDVGMQALTGPRNLDDARKLVAASGYKGERVVMIAPSDLPDIMAMSQVMQDTLTKVGLDVDFQVMDWGMMISRMAKRDPIGQGGWNCYCVTWAGLTTATPGSSYPLRASGLTSTSGWPTDDKLEALRQQWFDAPDLASQQAICRDMQQEAFISLPYIPLGQWYNPAAHRDKLTDFLRSPFTLFWNVRAV
jgi:peptide/nickel transport system substrate-binding protein